MPIYGRMSLSKQLKRLSSLTSLYVPDDLLRERIGLFVGPMISNCASTITTRLKRLQHLRLTLIIFGLLRSIRLCPLS